MSEKINVCYAADNNYAMQAGVSITSLLENDKDKYFNIYILCDKYEKENIERFKKIEKKYNCAIKLIDVTQYLLKLNLSPLYNKDSIKANGLITFMYARLFIGSLIPNNVEKLIYLDCDTIITKSLAPLYDIKLLGVFGAVRDLWPVAYNKVIGLKEDDLYFNSGVLLIDMNKWRIINAEEKIMEHISELKEDYNQHDQDILNVVFKNQIDTLPLQFNMMYISRKYSSELVLKFSDKTEKTYYNINEIDEAKKNSCVIHYAGDYFGRPWCYPNAGVYSKLWKKYFEMSLWDNVNLKIYRDRKQDFKYAIRKIISPVISNYWYKRTKHRFNNDIQMMLKFKF